MKKLFNVYQHIEFNARQFPYLFSKFRFKYDDKYTHKVILAESEEEAEKKYRDIYPKQETISINPLWRCTVRAGMLFSAYMCKEPDCTVQIMIEKIDDNNIDFSRIVKFMNKEDIKEYFTQQ